MTETFLRNKQWFFDRWAPSYDCLLTTVFYQAVHKRLLEYASLPNQANILDLGCGTGRLLDRIAKQFPTVTATGLDLSDEMILQAQSRNLYPQRLTFTTGNVESLPFVEHQFDAVFCTISFLHYPHPQLVFEQINRVLHPGGYFFLADYQVNEQTRQALVPFSPGGLRFYSRSQRAEFGQAVGWSCEGHYHLLGPILLTKFQKIKVEKN
ncbi:class I SAM-dependent methyltransferase [Lyngbya sp. PCC 8106]|uniref:class I SAM-dependent methyltransferase n=1 Tax=Lyngbya sp. (strain PCC 8106) TaxID=313612 RepID=UPI0000EA9A6F|nr:class I SAM-dependent methyltransferase [Lyngbya sp. PCC 8106]EAW34078.1 UbiE/COQ5 methyltransferase [Lyngbya sp. PCC 8106]